MPSISMAAAGLGGDTFGVRRYLFGGAWIGAFMLLLSLAAHLASCNATPGDTTYGNPNTLDRTNLPGEGGVAPLSCGGEGGAKKYDGGSCPSFAGDIFPYFLPTGKWRCTDKPCHGGSNAPLLDGTSAATCLASMHVATVAGRPLLPEGGTTDPTSVGLLCNLQGGCGTRMPESPGLDPTPDELCMISDWLSCGAPR
jgi:hypothetical protein